MMRLSAALLSALLVSACASSGFGVISGVTDASRRFSSAEVGGPQTPIAIVGAEHTGLSVKEIANGLRFPGRFSAGSSFAAAKVPLRANRTVALLSFTPQGQRVRGDLKFYDRSDTLGEGYFSLPKTAAGDPARIGDATASLILDILREAEIERVDDNNGRIRRR